MRAANVRRPRRAPGASDETTVGEDVQAIVPRPRDKSLPVASASAFAPVAGRRLWAATVLCPECGGGHLHRAEQLHELDGRSRRGGCGAVYRIVVRRRYKAGEAA